MTVAAVVVLCISAAITLQQAADAGPDQAPAAVRGGVSGRVTEAGTEAPLQQALVTLRGEGIAVPRSSITDENGAFSFRDVPPGRVRLTTSKPAYLQVTRLGTTSDRGGTGLSVRSGNESQVLLHMKKGAVIAGTIRTPSGEPMPDLPVYVYTADSVAARQPSSIRLTTHTDDRGMYRAYGLPRGHYLVATTLQTAGLGLLSVLDVNMATARLLRARQRSTPGGAVAPAVDEARYSLAPTYYPGTSAPSQAEPVFVQLGDVRDDVDFNVGVVRAVRLAGTVALSDGTQTARRLRVALLSHGRALTPRDSSSPRDVGPSDSGSFAFDNVPPGRYTIVAYDLSASGSGAERTMWGMVDVDVVGEDITTLSLVLRPAMSVSGRVETQGWLLKPPDMSTVQVVLTEMSPIGVSVLADDARGFSRTSQARVNPDGSFHVVGLLPGRYVVSCVVAGNRWTLSRGIHGEKEILDGGLEVGTTDLAGLTLQLVDQPIELAGSLTDAFGDPAQGYVVAVFPVERPLRSASRRIQTTQTDADGEFLFRGLPPGDYLLGVVRDLTADEIAQTDTLMTMERVSIPVTLVEGQRVRQDFAIQTENVGGSANR